MAKKNNSDVLPNSEAHFFLAAFQVVIARQRTAFLIISAVLNIKGATAWYYCSGLVFSHLKFLQQYTTSDDKACNFFNFIFQIA